LSNIIYDDSGTYTVNERHAAWRESYDQEEAWREKVAAQAMAEYNSTGKLTNFFKSVLDHFKELPAIEQAQYPKDYASDLQSKIDLDLNPVDHITADAIGKPGERVFFLQAVSGMQTVTLLIEKLQIQSLATGVAEFFDELLRHYPDLPAFSENFEEERMHIQPPVMPLSGWAAWGWHMMPKVTAQFWWRMRSWVQDRNLKMSARFVFGAPQAVG